jgi:fibronectin type 3 domain-containing protein
MLPTLGSNNVPAPDTMPPSTPTLQTSKATSSSATSFTWSAATDNVGTAGYYIYRNNSTTPIATTLYTYYQDSGLQNYTQYNYQVVAFDLGGNKAPPLSFSITTKNSLAPNPPTNLSGTSTAPTKVSLTWTAPTGTPITSYSILMGTSAGSLAQVATAAGTATSGNVSNLTPGTLYYFQVEATASGKTSGPSNTASVQTMNGPSAPAGLTATASSAQKIALSWQASTGPLAIRSYNVSRGATAANLAPLGVTKGTTYSDSTANPGTTYYYAVQAVDTSNNQSPFSAAVSVATPDAPGAPSDVSAAASSSTSVAVTWTGVTGGLPISTYTVFRGTSAANLASLGVTKNASYTDTTVTAGQTYYYAVQAKDTGGDLSPMSAIANVTTPGAPAAPTALAATANSCTKVSVTWTETTNGLPISTYTVFRGTSATNLASLGVAKNTSYTDTKAGAGQTYYYAVQAKDTGGNLSPMSATATVTTPVAPAAPTALAATANTSTKVTVTWSESSAGLPITSYKVWRGSTPSNMTNVATKTSATYIDTAVTTGTTYYYAVQAVDSGKDVSAMSATVAVTTP